MTPAQAKQLAAAKGYEFYWNRSLQLYACYDAVRETEASYHTRASLEPMTAEKFDAVYLSDEGAR